MSNKDTDQSITWETIRSQWVNGECAEVRELVENLERPDFMRIVQEAITQAMRLKYGSGDLADLREIMAFRGGNYDY